MDGCDSNQEDVTQEDNGEASFGRVVFGGIWWYLVVSGGVSSKIWFLEDGSTVRLAILQYA